MPRKAKVKEEATIDDLSLRLVKGWANLRKGVADFVNNVEECTVELHFESSLDARTHFNFEPDEAVFIADIEVSPNNQVIFIMPYGSKNKSFNYQEAELISTKTSSSVNTLQSVVAEIYKTAFADVPEAPTITILERKYLAVQPELRDLLNNAEDVIKQHELSIERGAAYSKLEQFGIF
jgi:hypothetical protein